MDTDFIGMIVGVVLAALIGWFESRAKKSKEKKNTYTHPPQPLFHNPEPVQEAQPVTFLQSEEEGKRVTADPRPETLHHTAPASHTSASPALKPLDTDQLRKAVIWGEILRPKF